MTNITPDEVADIVAKSLDAETATAYAPTNPMFGIIVVVDETWIGSQFLEYVRIDGLMTRGHAVEVRLSTTGGNFCSGQDDPSDLNDREVRIANRIMTAINEAAARS